MKLYWRRIRITDGLAKDSEDFKKALDDAKKHPSGGLPALGFTESNVDWVLLYNHARKGQIDPRVMKYMRRSDLYYLAGLSFPHPALAAPKDEKLAKLAGGMFDDSGERWEQLTKLQGNAVRAKVELERRNFFWATTFVVVAAISGALIGSFAAAHL